MIFTKNSQRFRVVIGLDGGVYVCRWRDNLRRHNTPCWQIVGSEDIE